MKWFKHFSNAYKSLKINSMIDDLGIKGYGYYWLLVEVLAENFDGTNDVITLHYVELSSRIRIKSRSKLIQFLQKMESHSLLSYKNSGEFFEIKFPILKELQDRDSKYNKPKRVSSATKATLEEEVEEDKKKNKSNTPLVPLSEGSNLLELPDQNKIEIHSAVNQSLNSDMERQNVPSEFDPKKWVGTEGPKVSPKFTPDELMDLWNQKMGAEFGYSRGFGGGDHRKHVMESLNYLKTAEAWCELFDKCKKSKHLTGGSESGWTVNLLWLVNYDNALKVLSDVYDDSKVIRNLFAGIKDDSAEVGS